MHFKFLCLILLVMILDVSSGSLPQQVSRQTSCQVKELKTDRQKPCLFPFIWRGDKNVDACFNPEPTTTTTTTTTPEPEPENIDYSDPSSGLWRPINNDYDIVECGTRLKITNIVGGKTAKLGDYPYMALLGSTQQNPRTKKTETFYTCGGSLINKWYVLTAAHCVQTGTGEEIKLSEIVLGEYESGLDPDCESGFCIQNITRTVGKVIIHENYGPGGGSVINDIALVRLNEPVPLYDDSEEETKPGTKPICLPWPSTDEDIAPTLEKIGDLNNGENVVVSGWGRTSNKNRREFQKLIRNKIAVKKLQYLKTKTANDLCKEKISQDVNTDLQLCAGGEQGSDSCNGDSGGPLVYRIGPDYPYYQVGVVSFGTSKCGAGSPGVYTKVVAFMVWVGENMEP